MHCGPSCRMFGWAMAPLLAHPIIQTYRDIAPPIYIYDERKNYTNSVQISKHTQADIDWLC